MTAARAGSKHARDLIRQAQDMGFACTTTGSGHLRFQHSSAAVPVVFTPKTPRARGGHKEFQKLRTALRRAMEGHAG